MSIKVYKITNLINGKVYVGITGERYLARRFWHHANRKRSSGAYLHWSIQKYGVDNFRMEVLFEFAHHIDAKTKERELISLWQLNRHKHPAGNGMNLTDGGDGSYGCKHSDESIAKMSGSNNHNYGLVGANNPTSKAISQYDDTGRLVATYDSMYQAAQMLRPGCTRRQASSIAANIRTSIVGRSRLKSAYGYTWRYSIDTA